MSGGPLDEAVVAMAGTERVRARIDADALLFDNDGTLVDTTPAVDRAWRDFAERYGVDPEELLAVAHGVRADETIRRFLPDALAAEAAAWLDGRELELVHETVAVPGARELLTRLTELGAPWAIVTSANTLLVRARLAAAGLPTPPVVVTADDVPVGKPDPACYLLAASRLGVAPERCIVVEDVAAGLQAGRAAGARVVVRGDYAGPEAEGLHRLADYLGADVSLHEQSPRLRGLW